MWTFPSKPNQGLSQSTEAFLSKLEFKPKYYSIEKNVSLLVWEPKFLWNKRVGANRKKCHHTMGNMKFFSRIRVYLFKETSNDAWFSMAITLWRTLETDWFGLYAPFCPFEGYYPNFHFLFDHKNFIDHLSIMFEVGWLNYPFPCEQFSLGVLPKSFQSLA